MKAPTIDELIDRDGLCEYCARTCYGEVKVFCEDGGGCSDCEQALANYMDYHEEEILMECMKIVKVVYNDPATIVWFGDGTKVVVKCYNEAFDKEKGLAMAVMRKLYGRSTVTDIIGGDSIV